MRVLRVMSCTKQHLIPQPTKAYATLMCTKRLAQRSPSKIASFHVVDKECAYIMNGVIHGRVKTKCLVLRNYVGFKSAVKHMVHTISGIRSSSVDHQIWKTSMPRLIDCKGDEKSALRLSYSIPRAKASHPVLIAI